MTKAEAKLQFSDSPTTYAAIPNTKVDMNSTISFFFKTDKTTFDNTKFKKFAQVTLTFGNIIFIFAVPRVRVSMLNATSCWENVSMQYFFGKFN